MTETGFVKAHSDNLPKIDAFIMPAYFASNLDFMSAEIKGVKAARSERESYCELAVGHVQVKGDGDICVIKARITPEHNVDMEKVESALDVLSRAATMVQPSPAYPASDSDSFETPSTASSGESEGDRTLSPETPRAQPKELTGKWRRERRSTRLPDYRPRENGKMALRSQSFNERRSVASVARAQPHSEGELSDEADDAPANLAINGKRAPPEYPGAKNEAPIDMRLRSRPAPPPYTRPSVITKSDTPPGSMSMCDPVIDEHFRRSLGDDYMNLFKKNNPEVTQPLPKPNMKDRASSPIQFKTEEVPKPAKIIAMEVDDASMSVDDHFAKALGDTWRQIQTSRLKDSEKVQTSKGGVDDHFSKALGDTWKQIQTSKLNLDSDNEKPKDQTTKIISRSGVVI